MRRCDRVIAARHHHHLAVADGDRLVEIARVGIDALEGEPLWGIEPVVIGLLERGFLTRHIAVVLVRRIARPRSEEHTSELQSLMRSSYAGFRLNNKNASYNYQTQSK